MGESESFTVIDSIYIQYYWSCRVLGLDLEVGIVKRRFHFYYIGKTLDKQHIYTATFWQRWNYLETYPCDFHFWPLKCLACRKPHLVKEWPNFSLENHAHENYQ